MEKLDDGAEEGAGLSSHLHASPFQPQRQGISFDVSAKPFVPPPDSASKAASGLSSSTVNAAPFVPGGGGGFGRSASASTFSTSAVNAAPFVPNPIPHRTPTTPPRQGLDAASFVPGGAAAPTPLPILPCLYCFVYLVTFPPPSQHPSLPILATPYNQMLLQHGHPYSPPFHSSISSPSRCASAQLLIITLGDSQHPPAAPDCVPFAGVDRRLSLSPHRQAAPTASRNLMQQFGTGHMLPDGDDLLGMTAHHAAPVPANVLRASSSLIPPASASLAHGPLLFQPISKAHASPCLPLDVHFFPGSCPTHLLSLLAWVSFPSKLFI